jgi:hypothetical protein
VVLVGCFLGARDNDAAVVTYILSGKTGWEGRGGVSWLFSWSESQRRCGVYLHSERNKKTGGGGG